MSSNVERTEVERGGRLRQLLPERLSCTHDNLNILRVRKGKEARGSGRTSDVVVRGREPLREIPIHQLQTTSMSLSYIPTHG